MPDREKVIGHLNDCMEASRRDNTWVFVRKDIVENALAMLKDQEAIVRCKDCIFGKKEKNNSTEMEWIYCQHHRANRPTEWFCYSGERLEKLE